MSAKLSKGILAGIIATIIMTLFMMVAPLMGFPKMSPPEMLSKAMNVPISVGWLMHFMIGIVFALMYGFFFLPRLIGKSIVIRGLIFGVFAFVFGQIMMSIMSTIFPMPAIQGSMALMMVGSLLGHLIFGYVVAQMVK